jgi:hypothetical protein
MLSKVLVFTTILSVALLALMLCFTTPASVGPFGVLAFFVLVYLVFLGLMTGSVYFFSFVLFEFTKGLVLARPLKQISVKRAYYYGSVLAMVPVLILAMQSFGNIGFMEFSLTIVFAVIGCFLVSKR